MGRGDALGRRLLGARADVVRAARRLAAARCVAAGVGGDPGGRGSARSARGRSAVLLGSSRPTHHPRSDRAGRGWHRAPGAWPGRVRRRTARRRERSVRGDAARAVYLCETGSVAVTEVPSTTDVWSTETRWDATRMRGGTAAATATEVLGTKVLKYREGCPDECTVGSVAETGPPRSRGQSLRL